MRNIDHGALTTVLRRGAQEMSLDLSDRQMARLMDYLVLLTKWNAVYNLTAVRDPMQMVTQHLLDSLAAVAAFSGAKQVLDVGAGGGLPGIVLAIWAAEAQPMMHVSMIDTVHKKTAFLTQVKAELNLDNVSVYTNRVEQWQSPQKFDVITSRAFAELSDFIMWSSHLLAEDGRYIALKGVTPTAEISGLPHGWVVTEVRSLCVATLQAERHLVFIESAQKGIQEGVRGH